jgi:hypothetical protein
VASRSTNLNVRVLPREMKLWASAARRADVTLSAWVREALTLRASPPPAQVPATVSGDQIELPFSKKTKRRTA